MVCACAISCSSDEDRPPEVPTTPKAAASATGAAEPPKITVDLTKIASELAATYAVQATLIESMAKGRNLTAAETEKYWASKGDAARQCDEICQMLRKNPRWQRQMTAALEANTKQRIIQVSKCTKSFDAARKNGSAGKPASAPPEAVVTAMNKFGMSEVRVKGFMPYTKKEME